MVERKSKCLELSEKKGFRKMVKILEVLLIGRAALGDRRMDRNIP